MDDRGACKHGQCYLSKWLWLSMAQHANRAAWSPGRLLPRSFSPSDCLCIYFESVQVCVCVWGPGSFKHCSKSIALIKGITSQKKEKQETHTQAALRSSVKLDKSEIYKVNVCHIANDNTRKRFLEQKKNIAAKIKERKERYVFTMSPGFVSVPLWWRTILFLGQPTLNLASESHRLVTVVGSGPNLIQAHAYCICICACVQVYCMYCICECLCVSVHACHHKRVVGWFTSR